MLKEGTQAPNFTLKDQHGQEHSLHTLLLRAGLILYFYPADFTHICTKQACMYRDQLQDLNEAGLNVAGISAQDVESHHRFAHEYKLNFPILADTNKSVIRAYEAVSLGMIPRRVTYFIDQDATIVDATLADLKLNTHRDFTMRVLKEFQVKV